MINVNILNPVLNYNSGKFIITNTSTGTPGIVAGVIRVTAPDGLIYYSAGNSASTFTDPLLSVSPDFDTNNNICGSIDIPLAFNGLPQLGIYSIEVAISDGTDVFTMTPFSFQNTFVAPVISINHTLDCLNANLQSADATNYGINASVVRSHSFDKVVSEPAAVSLDSTGATISLGYPLLHSGEYTTEIISAITVTNSNHTITVTLTGEKTTDIQCSKGVCDVYCGVKTLEMNIADAKSSGNSILVAKLTEKLQTIAAYITLYNAAIKCEDTTGATNYIQSIMKVGGFTNSCCGDDDNYQIKPIGAGENSSLITQFNGLTISTSTSAINFTGAVDVEENNGVTNVNIIGGGVDIQEEGVTVAESINSINFTGGVSITLDVDGNPVINIEPSNEGGSVYNYNALSGTTAANLAGVPAGTIFPEGTPVEDVLRAILNPFQNPSFTSFSSTIFTAYEVGQNVPSGLQTVNYSINNWINVISGSGLPTTNVSGATFPVNPVTLSASGNFQVNIASNTTLTTPGSRSVSLRGTNTLNAFFSASGNISWLFRVYYGNSTSETLDASGILSLGGSQLASGFANNYTISDLGFKYICIPDVHGSPTNFIDTSNNFAVPIATEASNAFYSNVANGQNYGIVSITNNYGITTNYRVYRSANQIVGLTIKVS